MIPVSEMEPEKQGPQGVAGDAARPPELVSPVTPDAGPSLHPEHDSGIGLPHTDQLPGAQSPPNVSQEPATTSDSPPPTELPSYVPDTSQLSPTDGGVQGEEISIMTAAANTGHLAEEGYGSAGAISSRPLRGTRAEQKYVQSLLLKGIHTILTLSPLERIPPRDYIKLFEQFLTQFGTKKDTVRALLSSEELGEYRFQALTFFLEVICEVDSNPLSEFFLNQHDLISPDDARAAADALTQPILSTHAPFAQYSPAELIRWELQRCDKLERLKKEREIADRRSNPSMVLRDLICTGIQPVFSLRGADFLSFDSRENSFTLVIYGNPEKDGVIHVGTVPTFSRDWRFFLRKIGRALRRTPPPDHDHSNYLSVTFTEETRTLDQFIEDEFLPKTFFNFVYGYVQSDLIGSIRRFPDFIDQFYRPTTQFRLDPPTSLEEIREKSSPATQEGFHRLDLLRSHPPIYRRR